MLKNTLIMLSNPFTLQMRNLGPSGQQIKSLLRTTIKILFMYVISLMRQRHLTPVI